MPSNDIKEILLRIKENIKVVEDGSRDFSVLDAIEADYLALLDLIKLFLISERDSYYGYFLMNMQFSANFRSESIAGIRLNTFPPLFESNPLLLCKFTLKEIIYIVCHEIDHVLLNHPAEMVKVNPGNDPDKAYRFNLAADAAVNDRIDHEIVAEKHSFMSAPEGVINSRTLAELLKLKSIRSMENYAYYFALIEEAAAKEDAPSLPRSGQQNMMDKTSDVSSQPSAVSRQQGDDNDEGEQHEIVTAKNCDGKITDHDWQAGEDAEDAAATVREFVNAAVSMMNEESRGMMPGYFMSLVKEINRPPEISWQAILKKYVGTIVANKRKTRMRLNRRQPERFDLSGSVDDKTLKIVVAVDTSASVSDVMIGKIFNEIFSILAKRKHDITVIECDAAVRRVYKAKTPADIKKKVAGRGGTRFNPVIEYVNKDKYYRDALLIYFTDGYGEGAIEKPRTYRNIWVVIGDARHLSLKEPYGAVLTL